MVSDSFCLQKEVCIFVAFVHLRWRKGQKTLCFTGVLWAIFAYLAVVRSGVTRQYEVQEALVNYVESIISHPGVSGVRLRTPGETGMCRSQLRKPCPTPEIEGANAANVRKAWQAFDRNPSFILV